MIDTKPYDILCSLSQYELNRFDRYFAALSNDETQQKLWNYVKPFFKEKTAHQIDKDELWTLVIGTGKMVPLKYARLLSDFTKVIEKFLLLEHYTKHETARALKLTQIYNTRGLVSCIQPQIKVAEESMKKNTYRDGEYYLSQYLIDEQQNIYIESLDRREGEKHLTQTMASLDIYYVIQKLKYYASALHYQKFLNQPIRIAFAEDLMRFAQAEQLIKVPLIKIYVSIIHTLLEKNGHKAFEELRDSLALHAQLFPNEESEQLYAFAVNYCIRMINKGELEYLQKVFALYKQMLAEGLLTYKGSMSPWEFKNIVTVALRAKELKWAENFIDTQSVNVPQRDRENAYTFNMARYAFAAKRYDQVLSLLGSVEYDDVFYQLDAKATLMKTYYELGEYQPLLSLKESFRMLLSRKKLISETQRSVYDNFVRFTLRLFRVDVKDKKKLQALKKEIDSTPQMADKGWILEKWNELNG